MENTEQLIELSEVPTAKEIYMVAGWEQWADAGAISSGLPAYLIDKTNARKIGEIVPQDYYLFQLPGTHHLLRPEIELEEGYRKALRKPQNEFYYSGDEEKGLVIFMGHEPHMKADRYVEAFLRAVQRLDVKRVGAVGGVYGAMPYDQDREVSCVYSMPHMKEDLTRYAVRFSDYEGGTTIGTYIVDRAERLDIEFFVFYGFVPAYDFSQLSIVVQSLRIENDFKAWYDLLRRFDHMFDLDIDLSDLRRECETLLTSMDEKIDEIDEQMPELEIRAYIEELSQDFIARPFIPLGDVWERGLRDIFDDLEQ